MGSTLTNLVTSGSKGENLDKIKEQFKSFAVDAGFAVKLGIDIEIVEEFIKLLYRIR